MLLVEQRDHAYNLALQATAAQEMLSEGPPHHADPRTMKAQRQRRMHGQCREEGAGGRAYDAADEVAHAPVRGRRLILRALEQALRQLIHVRLIRQAASSAARRRAAGACVCHG